MKNSQNFLYFAAASNYQKRSTEFFRRKRRVNKACRLSIANYQLRIKRFIVACIRHSLFLIDKRRAPRNANLFLPFACFPSFN
jgi:hypothetical protein